MDASLLNNPQVAKNGPQVASGPQVTDGQNASPESAAVGAGAESSASARVATEHRTPSGTRPGDGKSPSGNWLFFNVLLPLGILAVGALTVVLIGNKAAPTKPPEDQRLPARIKRLPVVNTLPVRSLESVGGFLQLKVDGEVVPHREVQIATEVAGQITYKDPLCKVGSFITEGQLLFRIDPSDYENEVERLSKLKEQEYQAIRELEQESINIKRLVELAMSELELQEREIRRLKALPAGYASQSELDQAQRSRLQAINSKVTLENQLDLARQRRARLEAAEQLAQTQLDMAEKNLSRTEIRSPISGVIFREDAELNSFVQRGEVIITIEDTSKAEVVVNLRGDQLFWVLDQDREESDSANKGGEIGLTEGKNEKDNTQLAQDYSLPKTQATIQYALAGRENEVLQWAGTLERYDGIGFDTTSRTVPVRVVVDQPRRFKADSMKSVSGATLSGPSALVRGMFVSVILHVQPRKPLVVIPAVALKPGSTGNRLWKFEPDMSVLNDPKLDGASTDSSADDTKTSNLTEMTMAATGVELTTPESESELGDEDGTEEGEEFDIEPWVVGRVEVLERVRAVESVVVPVGQDEDGKVAIGSNGKATYWICEVGEGQLQAGDRLIVSPLPSFEGKGRDGVRAPKTQVSVD